MNYRDNVIPSSGTTTTTPNDPSAIIQRDFTTRQQPKQDALNALHQTPLPIHIMKIWKDTKVLGYKISSGRTSIWLINIAASAQTLSILSSSSAQLAHLLAQAAQAV